MKNLQYYIMPCTCCKPKSKESNLMENTFHIKNETQATCLNCDKTIEVSKDLYFNTQNLSEVQYLEFLHKHSGIFEFLYDDTEADEVYEARLQELDYRNELDF